MAVTFSIQAKVDAFQLQVAAQFKKGITGVYGPSGSGKTTLLKTLAGFIEPDVGSIIVHDQVYFSSDKGINLALENRRIGMVWQEALLFPHMNVEENILYGRGKKCLASFSASVIDIFDIRSLLGRMPDNLSGGEKQRVAIARALLHEPELLLMDEPVSALDRPARLKILSYLQIINQQLKIPICYVSHSISELMFLCHEVLVLDSGRRLCFDVPEKVLINEYELSRADEEFENILELPVKILKRDEKVAELDFGGGVMRTTFQRDDAPQILKIGIKARDILIALDQIHGISARNKMPAVIEKIVQVGDLVMLHCRVNDSYLWAEITPGSFRELKLHTSQIVYLIIKSRSVRILG